VGSTHATIRDDADRDGWTDGRGDDSPGDHAKVDRRPEGRDRRDCEGCDAKAKSGLEEVPIAQGCHRSEAHHGEESHHPEVAEACLRREEGRDHTEAQDGSAQDGSAQDGSAQGCDDSEAHHGAESRHPQAHHGS
jgi:hypothetical protein